MNKGLENECLSCGDLFSDLRGKRIFMTGGTGLFGKWLLSAIAAVNRDPARAPVEMTVLSRNPEQFRLKHPELAGISQLTFCRGDVRHFLFPEGRFDYVLHAAAEFSPALEHESPEEMHSVIFDGAQRVVEFAAKAGVSRFLMTSSGAVYGTQPAGMSHIPESYLGSPKTVYGKAKLLAEQLCVEAGDRGGFTVLLPRCFAFVGPHLKLDGHFAIGNFIRDCLENRPIVIQGDGTPLRSYLYATDLAEWLWTILLRGTHGRPYNVGSGEAIAIFDLAQLVRQCAGTQHPVTVLKTPVPGATPNRYVPSVDRAFSELGLQVRCSLKESIERTLAAYRA